MVQAKKQGTIQELNLKTRRPLRDIAEIEEYVASRATAIIATSENVKKELLAAGIAEAKIHLIHNALEDYWFDAPLAPEIAARPSIVFLGRIGGDAFTLNLKGFDRLVHIYQRFSEVPKYTFCITANKHLAAWLRTQLPNHALSANIQKDRLPGLLNPLRGSVLFVPSRYEGFSLSLVEGMSQGLIPVTYPIGVAPEIIRDGENGFIVHSQAEAIEKIELILLDASLRERLSKTARETSEAFTSVRIAKKLIELYDAIIHAHARENKRRHTL